MIQPLHKTNKQTWSLFLLANSSWEQSSPEERRRIFPFCSKYYLQIAFWLRAEIHAFFLSWCYNCACFDLLQFCIYCHSLCLEVSVSIISPVLSGIQCFLGVIHPLWPFCLLICIDHCFLRGGI